MQRKSGKAGIEGVALRPRSQWEGARPLALLSKEVPPWYTRSFPQEEGETERGGGADREGRGRMRRRGNEFRLRDKRGDAPKEERR